MAKWRAPFVSSSPPLRLLANPDDCNHLLNSCITPSIPKRSQSSHELAWSETSKTGYRTNPGEGWENRRLCKSADVNILASGLDSHLLYHPENAPPRGPSPPRRIHWLHLLISKHAEKLRKAKFDELSFCCGVAVTETYCTWHATVTWWSQTEEKCFTITSNLFIGETLH